MLVSLKKTKWVMDWVRDEFMNEFHSKWVVPNKLHMLPFKGKQDHGTLMRKLFVDFLATKGYKAKSFEGKEDVIISLEDKKYTWLVLKYG